MTALAAASAVAGQPGLALLAAVGMAGAQLLSLWGYERRSNLAMLSGIAFGVLLLPSILTALPLGEVLISLLTVPATLLQLDFGLKRLQGRPDVVQQPV